MASVNDEVTELSEALNQIPWSSTFTFDSSDKQLHHQTAYNKAIATALLQKGWRMQPLLNNTPRLIGDFAKGLVFGEVQFGNSATLYRDFYKFQFGLQNGLLSLAVLIVPHNEINFFQPENKCHQYGQLRISLKVFHSITHISTNNNFWLVGR
jgi:hypothetical protein